jgi:outer membrane protein assembly factor BamB
LWSAPIAGHPMTGGPTPVIADGRVIVPTEDASIQAYALADGHALWTFRGAPGTTYRDPVVAGEVVICAEQSGIEAIDPATGARRWRHELQGCGLHVAVAGDRAYVGSFISTTGGGLGGMLVALDLVHGTRVWSVGMWDWPFGGPTICGDELVVFGNQGVAAFARADGRFRWMHAQPRVGTGQIGIDDRQRIVLGTDDAHLRMLEPVHGNVVLDVDLDPLAAQVHAPMVPAEVQAGTGTASAPPTIGGFDPPALVQDRVYVATTSGWLTAIDLPGITPAGRAPAVATPAMP